ncbi:MAG TPA: hypothetical protein VLR92_00975, partial [Blastocatellia bacterium]|nr:hypothetical protein [Blastocatellia bacterium]
LASADSINAFDGPMIVQVYAYLAGAYQHYGLYVEADNWARTNVEFGRRHNLLFAEATGYEFLGENAVHKGEFKMGLEFAEREFEIADKLHSRERRVWTHFVAAMCSFFLGDSARSEREYTEGIALAELIGELRGAALLKGNYAILLADKADQHASESISDQAERQRLFDEALAVALENFEAGERLGLLYSRFDAHRCLADVRFRRGESGEAERLCAATDDFISDTESRVSQLWLGPLHIDVLLAAAKQAEAEGKTVDALSKRSLAAEKLARYQELVAKCQSPRFTSEGERLTVALK